MKRSITFILCSFLCIICHAQKKIFNAAIAAGRSPNSFYVIQNPKNKMLKLEKLKEYAQKNGYILGRSTLKNISRFGNQDTSVATLEFLPVSEFESYVISNIFSGNSFNISKCQSQGAAYYFSGWDSSTLFKRLYDVKWSGNVKNGKLEGDGIGYLYEENRRIICVEGTFEGGFPTGPTKTTIYDFGGKYGPFITENVEKESVIVGKMNNGIAMIERNGSYGFVNSEGKMVVEPIYRPDQVIDLSKNISQGAAFYFSGWDDSTLFKRVDNFNWNGVVKNETLEGDGIGFFNEDNRRIICVEGTFEGGFPIGLTKTIIFDIGKNNDSFMTKSTTVGKMYEGMAMIEYNGSYGFVNSEGRLAVTPMYKKVIQQFADGQAIVEFNKREAIIDNKGNFIDFTENQKRIDKEAAEATAGLTFRTFTKKEIMEDYTGRQGTTHGILTTDEIAENLEELGFTLLYKKTEPRLDYYMENYYDATIFCYSKTIYDQTTTVTYDEGVVIKFPKLKDVEDFVSSAKACGLKKEGNMLLDNEKIYWYGTDVEIDGTTVTLIIKWEA